MLAAEVEQKLAVTADIRYIVVDRDRVNNKTDIDLEMIALGLQSTSALV